MWTVTNRRRCAWTLFGLLCASVAVLSCSKPADVAHTAAPVYRKVAATHNIGGYMFKYPAAPSMDESKQRPEGFVQQANATCVACHSASDGDTMHNGKLSNSNATVVSITCVDCHGGNNDVNVPTGLKKGDPGFDNFKYQAHVEPTRPEIWEKDSARNPEIQQVATLKENVDYIRFINPGDLRAAQASCGACHNTDAEEHIVDRVKKSMMANGQMLWGAALYNNGAINSKTPVYGGAYDPNGKQAKIYSTTRPSVEDVEKRGMLVSL